MTTLKLKVSDSAMPQVLGLLRQFNADDVEILESDNGFEKQKAELQNELKRYETGKAEVFTVEEADQILERTIREYEARDSR